MSHITVLAGVSAVHNGERFQVVSFFHTDEGERMAECYRSEDVGNPFDEDETVIIPVDELSSWE